MVGKSDFKKNRPTSTSTSGLSIFREKNWNIFLQTLEILWKNNLKKKYLEENLKHFRQGNGKKFLQNVEKTVERNPLNIKNWNNWKNAF